MAIRPLNSIAGFSAGDPAITVIQANADITTINLTANGISNLGPVSNLILTGGSNGQFIQTDGAGNLSFATISTSSISNGNSNVSIDTVDGNVTVSVNGNANVAIFTDTGANLLNLDVQGVTNLGNVGNVHIDGGSNGQYLKTDGAGNLQWDDIGNIAGNSAAPMPYFIEANTSFIVNEFKQGLYSQPIEIDGELVVDGMLIEISDTVQSTDNQVLFDFNGVPTGNAGFEFQYWDGNLNVPGNINANGHVIPAINDVYDLGSTSKRWRNGYFGGNTIYLGNATIGVDANGYVVITNQIGGTFTVEGTTASGTNEIENGNSNVLVYANSNIAMTVAGTSNVVVVTTTGAIVTGNVDATGLKTDNLYHANGSPWNLGQDPGGSNTQIQFNDSGNFNGSAALTFNKSTNTFTTSNLVISNTVAGNLIPSANVTYSLGNATNAWKDLYLSGNTLYIADETMQVNSATGVWTFSSNTTNVTLGTDSYFANIYATNLYANSGVISANLLTGTLTTAAQPNITSLGTLTSLDSSGNISAGGVKTDNLYYSNGTPYNLGQDPGGSNTQIQFNTNGNFDASANLTFNTTTNILAVTGAANVSGNITAGNISGGNVVSANYLVSNSGCVVVGIGHIAVTASTGGIFNSSVNDINLGLAANVTVGSTSGNTTIRGNLIANNNVYANSGNVIANLVTGTLTTAAQPNITSVGTLTSLSVTGNITANNYSANIVSTNSVVSKRNGINVTTLTVIDSFPISAYRTAKYVVSSQNDDGYESLEVLLIHNDINSYVTVYGAINDGGGNTVTMSTGITSGNVELRATGLASNTVVKIIGTYIPD